ncbi:hypothetical protein GRI89_04185 [Altererythrobacter salegens]|uniref:Uncharacterized protein n=1 Tax=Croceibacterium salegens TaxID=1737568 RepID=A0A6I4ST82_9SPHN|nr:hypothetical protein [Croceibacterium salegens]MXO58739.1 hypothetical protein [Croceibacterium salegens]
MRRISPALLLVAGMFFTSPVAARQHVAGDTWLITIETKTESKSESGSGSSFDRDTLIEKVLATTDQGVELEYDLPESASDSDRSVSWQFPARILHSNDGELKLLNEAELEARVERFLEFAGYTREACGHWIFTWNAFQIECDPQSVLELIAPFDLRPGEVFSDPNIQRPVALTTQVDNDGTSRLSASAVIDGNRIRESSAQTDVVVAEISGKELSLDQARQVHAKDVVSGTLEVSFELDATGNVIGRVKAATITVTEPDSPSETRSMVETTVRKRVEESPSGLTPAS